VAAWEVMKTTMDTTHIPTLKQMADFVRSEAVQLKCATREEAYGYIERVIKQHYYATLKKPDKGIVRAYLIITTGYGDAQLDRLLGRYKAYGAITAARRSQPTFTGIYTRKDIAELARIDDLLDGLSGSATCRVLKREYTIFGNTDCERLQHLSVAQLYRFRQSGVYRSVRTHYTKTKSAKIPIGERTKPRNDGRPGFLRVDSVHQGDKDGEKGVYHINLVDEVTQWEAVVCVEGVSEQFMIPALEAALRLFPFVLLNFHSDNGSEYINYKVADLLQRMLVKLTKSRPYHSGDNGLAETKNGAVVRKALGWTHIPRTPDNVVAINRWYMTWFIPYLNFHRACAFRTTTIDAKTGKRTHSYPKDGYMMPYEKLKSLLNAKQYLKPGTTFEILDLQAYAFSDTEWAEAMQTEKAAMWESVQF
jgi:transposase InsO family protein